MSTPRWVLSPRITAGFTLAFALFLAAGAGGVFEEILDAEVVATSPPGVPDARAERRARGPWCSSPRRP